MKDNFMSRRAAGIVLVGCAALLESARYLAAAIYGSNMISWNADLFQAMLQYVGNGLVVWSRAMLIVGIVYLVWAEMRVFHSRRQKRDELDC
jgi:hypothetical protein